MSCWNKVVVLFQGKLQYPVLEASFFFIAKKKLILVRKPVTMYSHNL